MTSQEQRSVPAPVVVALGLLALGLVLLGVGGFVRFHDGSGAGSDQWILPLGVLAALVVAAGAGISLVTTKSRLWFGGALVLLDAVLVWQSVTNDGFRFVWSGDQGEQFMLQVAIGMIGLVLLATAIQPPGSAESWLVRAALYLSGVVAAVIIAFFIGASAYDSKYCTEVGSCDADDLSGLVWGVNGGLIALGVGLVLIVTTELVLRSRRQRAKVGTPA